MTADCSAPDSRIQAQRINRGRLDAFAHDNACGVRIAMRMAGSAMLAWMGAFGNGLVEQETTGAKNAENLGVLALQ